MKTLAALIAFALLGTTLAGAGGALEPPAPSKAQHRLAAYVPAPAAARAARIVYPLEHVRCWTSDLQPGACRP